ncbi:MAG: M23 family metallopeptidase [Rhodospirillales bacterium]
MLALTWPTTAADAGDLILEGPLVQGGLVVGRTEPGTQVAVDGRRVRVSAEGAFLIGFGRDAGPLVSLRIQHPDGTRTERTLAVAAREYPVQRIDGLPRKQVEPGPEELARIRDDNAKIADVRRRDTGEPFFASGFIWPAQGPLSGVFGSRRILNGKPRQPHNGVDVAAPRGAPVVAAADGVVALTHPEMFFTGKTVMIDHGHGLTSVYVHMDEILVTPGQRVTKGTPIGTVGMTGRVSGPHLHWGVSLFGTHLDPALLAGPQQHAGASDREGAGGR